VRGWCTKGSIRDLSLPEEEVITHVLKEGMSQGAFGVSFDAGYIFDGFIPFRELENVAKILAHTGRIFAINLEIRDESSIEFLERIFDLSKTYELNLLINNFEPFTTHSLLYESARQLFEKKSGEIHAHFGMRFFNQKLFHMRKFLPGYLREYTVDALHKEVHKRLVREDILNHVRSFPIGDSVIAKLPQPFQSYEGKTIQSFADARGITSEEGFLVLAELCGFEGYILCPLIDRGTLETFAVSPHSIISSLPFFAVKEGLESCSLRAFLDFQEKAQIIPLEKAIMKCTSIPAQKFGIQERGLLKENYIADIVVLRDFSPSYVLLNGEMVVEEGVVKRKKSGSVLLYK
jgi:hypothetical protein